MPRSGLFFYKNELRQGLLKLTSGYDSLSELLVNSAWPWQIFPLLTLFSSLKLGMLTLHLLQNYMTPDMTEI